MLKVSVEQHKDGDHLVISRIPWWSKVYEWCTDRVCPCCGLFGYVFEKFEWLEEKYYPLWCKFCIWPDKFEKELYRAPIESGCIAAKAIWNSNMCWHDDDCLKKESS
jgi:hypothetical protein